MGKNVVAGAGFGVALTMAAAMTAAAGCSGGNGDQTGAAGTSGQAGNAIAGSGGRGGGAGVTGAGGVAGAAGSGGGGTAAAGGRGGGGDNPFANVTALVVDDDATRATIGAQDAARDNYSFTGTAGQLVEICQHHRTGQQPVDPTYADLVVTVLRF